MRKQVRRPDHKLRSVATSRRCPSWQLMVGSWCPLFALAVETVTVLILRLPTAVSGAHTMTALGPVKEKIDKFNETVDLTAMPNSVAEQPRGSGAPNPSPTPRVMCRPVFTGSDVPLDITKVALPSEVMTQPEFDEKKEQLSHEGSFKKVCVIIL